MADTHRYIGAHADHLEHGRPLAPGQGLPEGAVDPKQPKDAQLIADGLIIDLPDAKAIAANHLKVLKERAGELGVKATGKAEEISAAIAAAEAELETLTDRARELSLDVLGLTVQQVREAIEQAEQTAAATEVTQ